MKRWLFWSFVSVSTFLVGTFLVYAYLQFKSAKLTADEINEQPIETATQLAPLTDFVPEFRDLPSFDDLAVYRKPHGRLIHGFEDGIYRESEVVAENGEPWLVLVKRNENYALERASATVRKLKSVSWPGDERDAKLTFAGIDKPILALNHFLALVPGPVKTVSSSSLAAIHKGEMSNGFQREFELNGTRYRMRTSTGITTAHEKVAVLVLESGGMSQVITQVPKALPSDRDIIGNLLWAGDLDGDGRLDLYFDEFNEKGFTATYLFLSSLAQGRKLVDFAAWFGAAGC